MQAVTLVDHVEAVVRVVAQIPTVQMIKRQVSDTALVGVAAYLAWTVGRTGAIPRGAATVHPGERWLVLANTVAFGSAYVLGAWTASFVLVLAVHHEVQYLYFTYAMARRSEEAPGGGLLAELRRLARFARWPAVGLASWAVCTYSGYDALLPFLDSAEPRIGQVNSQQADNDGRDRDDDIAPFHLARPP